MVPSYPGETDAKPARGVIGRPLPQVPLGLGSPASGVGKGPLTWVVSRHYCAHTSSVIPLRRRADGDAAEGLDGWQSGKRCR